MMKSTFTENDILEISKGTKDKLEKIQSITVPYRYDLELNETDNYVYNNTTYRLTREERQTTKIFKSYNFPFLANSNHVPTFLYTLTKAVNKNLVSAMILTKSINGEEFAIPWDDIIIVRDGVDVYFVIYNTTIDMKVDNFNCLLIPYPVTYKTKLASEDEFPKTGFVFDNEGYAILDKYSYYQASMIIDINKDYLKCINYKFDDPTNEFTITKFNNGRLFANNIIIYHDNNIVTSNTRYIEYLDNNLFRFIDPAIATNVTLKVFYNSSLPDSVDNIFKLSKNGFKSLNGFKINDSVPDNFSKIFDNLVLDSKELNTKIDDILKYRKEILYPANKNITNSYLYSYTTTGANIIKVQDEVTGLTPLVTNRWIDEDGSMKNVLYPIIFVNNKLYKRYGSLKRENGKGLKFTLNTSKIQADDKVEMYFVGQSLEKTKETITVKSSTDSIKSRLDLTNCMLFESDPEPENYPNIVDKEDACFQYSIDFTCSKNSDGTYNITFKDDKYYNTKVVAVTNKQFLSYSDISEDGENVCIDLPESFAYAQNIDQYMVFVNGKKIDNEDLIFNFPKKDNPFTHVSIYSTILFGDGDSVDVIYMPYSVKTKYKADEISRDGIIKFEDGFLPCGINVNNVLVFVNGYKINNSDINIISDDVLRIESDILDSTKNISVIVPDIPYTLPTSLYKSDSWNEIVSGLSDDDLYVLFAGDSTISNTDKDMNDDKVEKNAVLLEIFRDYYAEYYDGDPFEYDGDESILDEEDRDLDMNYLVHVANAKKKNSINFNNLG